MLGSFAAEWLKLRRRAATYIIGAIWFVIVLGLSYLLLYFAFSSIRPRGGSGGGGSTVDRQALIATLLPHNLLHSLLPDFAGGLGGALILILAAMVTGGEYGWGTVKTILTQRPGRLSVLGGKMLAFGVVIILFVLLGFIAGALGSYIVALLDHATVSWPSVGDILKGMGVAYLVSAAWSALGIGLAILFRGTGLAIGLGLVYALVIESLIGGFAGLSDIIKNISKALIGTNGSALVGALPTSTPSSVREGGPSLGISATQATIVLALYVATFVVLALALFRQRDVA